MRTRGSSPLPQRIVQTGFFTIGILRPLLDAVHVGWVSWHAGLTTDNFVTVVALSFLDLSRVTNGGLEFRIDHGRRTRWKAAWNVPWGQRAVLKKHHFRKDSLT